MAQAARAYTPSLLANDDDVFDETNPSTWAYHVRIKREKEACEYTERKAQEICERIAAGEFLINICKDAGFTDSAPLQPTA
jgi:hypothetical protein